MRKSVAGLLVVLFALMLVRVGISHRQEQAPSPAAAPADPDAAPHQNAAVSAAVETSTPEHGEYAALLHRRDTLSLMVIDSDDLLATVRSLIPSATAGDAEAALAIFGAEYECALFEANKPPIGSTARQLMLDSVRPDLRDGLRHEMQRCDALYSANHTEVHDAAFWLNEAADHGSAAAIMSRDAFEDILSGVKHNSPEDIQRVMASRDPDVFVQIVSKADMAETPPEQVAVSGWAYSLMRCSLGADCGAGSYTLRTMCAIAACRGVATMDALMQEILRPWEIEAAHAEAQRLLLRWRQPVDTWAEH